MVLISYVCVFTNVPLSVTMTWGNDPVEVDPDALDSNDDDGELATALLLLLLVLLVLLELPSLGSETADIFL